MSLCLKPSSCFQKSSLACQVLHELSLPSSSSFPDFIFLTSPHTLHSSHRRRALSSLAVSSMPPMLPLQALPSAWNGTVVPFPVPRCPTSSTTAILQFFPTQPSVPWALPTKAATSCPTFFLYLLSCLDFSP